MKKIQWKNLMNKFIGLRPWDYVPHPANNEPKI